MKVLRPTDRDEGDVYHKFHPDDMIMLRSPCSLPTPLLEVKDVGWMHGRCIYLCVDHDTQARMHVPVSDVDRSYVRYEGEWT